MPFNMTLGLCCRRTGRTLKTNKQGGRGRLRHISHPSREEGQTLLMPQQAAALFEKEQATKRQARQKKKKNKGRGIV